MLFLGGLKDIMPGVDEFINKLIPSWQAFVIQVLATLILFFFIVKFLFKPVREILKKRQDFIESNINQSKISLAEAQKTKEECVTQLLNKYCSLEIDDGTYIYGDAQHLFSLDTSWSKNNNQYLL